MVAFGIEHLTSMVIILFSWIMIISFGVKLNEWQSQFFAMLLAFITILIEFFDDVYRFYDGYWFLAYDLPLHLCGFSTFISAYALKNMLPVNLIAVGFTLGAPFLIKESWKKGVNKIK